MSEEPITFDSVLKLCQDQRRRIVLRVLAEEQRPLTNKELAEAIFNYNQQMPPIEASDDVVTDIRVSLYQVHLPKLAAEGFINHDPERQLVEPTEQLNQVQPTVSTIIDADPSLNLPMRL